MSPNRNLRSRMKKWFAKYLNSFNIYLVVILVATISSFIQNINYWLHNGWAIAVPIIAVSFNMAALILHNTKPKPDGRT